MPVVALDGVSKSFGPIEALSEVDLELRHGDVIGLVGDNGAGKSTLVKVISGVHAPTSGSVYYDGERVTLTGPADARARGVETVYQDLALVNQLDVAGNLFLGREIIRAGPAGIGRWFGWLDHAAMRRRAREAAEELHVRIPEVAGTPVGQMSGGQRQGVAIARTVSWGRRALILDEPTAALGVQESEAVMVLIERLRQRETPMLIVSHNLPMVFRLCSRIVVLRLGHKVADLDAGSTTPDEIVALITGSDPGRFRRGAAGSTEAISA
jgi:ABC-type sugar transport system ATPase subunit